MSKVLALDYGSKRCGVATGDFDFGIAFPRAVIENKGDEYLFTELKKVIDEYGISTVVIGLPLRMEADRPDNPIMEGVKRFYDFAKEEAPELEFVLFDERLSSFEADELIGDLESKDAGALGRDAYAAQVILQRFFDKENT